MYWYIRYLYSKIEPETDFSSVFTLVLFQLLSYLLVTDRYKSLLNEKVEQNLDTVFCKNLIIFDITYVVMENTQVHNNKEKPTELLHLHT